MSRPFEVAIVVVASACTAPVHPTDNECADVAAPAMRAPDGTPVPTDVAAAFAMRMDAVGVAQASGDVGAVRAAVCDARRTLGAFQGVGEEAIEYRPTSGVADPRAVRAPYLATLDAQFAGKETWVVVVGVANGAPLSGPLREPCNIVRWYVASLPLAEAAQHDRMAVAARAGLDWLLRVQRPEGQFPYPDLSDDLSRYFASCSSSEDECLRAAPRDLQLHAAGVRAWERAGKPAGVYVDGWLVDDRLSDPGGLQFDTGVCTQALLDGYAAFADRRYLEGARRAGQYAQRQVAVPNWNYNAFSVELLAALERAEPGAGWGDAALAKARLGVLPGALPDGRWFDPHNARLVYHHILLRALLVLSQTTDDREVAAIIASATARSVRELEANGAAGLEEGLEALVRARDRGIDVGRALEILAQGSSDGGIRTGSLVYWLRAEL